MKEKRLCLCGCGQEINWKVFYKYTGWAKYILNHYKNRTRKGKTFEEIFGKEKTNNIKNLMRKNSYNTKIKKGKSYEELYGNKKAKLIKTKIKNSQKGISLNERYGKEKANLKKQKIKNNNKTHLRTGKTYEEIYGKERAIKIINNKKTHIDINKLINVLDNVFKYNNRITKSEFYNNKHVKKLGSF